MPVSSVTVTVYVPECASMVLGLEGFWSLDVKPSGPLQANVNGAVPTVTVALRFRVEPAQSGPLEEAETVTAAGATVFVVDVGGWNSA